MKKLGTIILILGLIFVGIGDSFLPKPLSTVSKNTRTHINKILLGLAPNPNIEKPSKQRENQIEEIENRSKRSNNN